jgi:predicted transcriptional regulator YheO
MLQFRQLLLSGGQLCRSLPERLGKSVEIFIHRLLQDHGLIIQIANVHLQLDYVPVSSGYQSARYQQEE